MRHYKRIDMVMADAKGAVGFAAMVGEIDGTVDFAFFGGPYSVIDKTFLQLMRGGVIGEYSLSSDMRPGRIGRRTVTVRNPDWRKMSLKDMITTISHKIAKHPNVTKVKFYKDYDKFLNKP